MTSHSSGTPDPMAAVSPRDAEGRRLSDVPLGQAFELIDVVLPPPEAEPLFERGLLPGSVLEMVRRSPSGDPIVRVDGMLLALRRETAAGLRVKRADGSD